MLSIGFTLLLAGISMILPGILKLRDSKVSLTFINSMRGPLGVDTGYSGQGTWRPIISGWGVILIALATITFGFFFTYYANVPTASLPAAYLMIIMVSGVGLAYFLVGFRRRLSRFDLAVALLGIMTFVILLIAQLVVSILLPAATTATAAPGISNFWVVMFYFSAGVAEEALFSLFLISVLVNAFKFKLGVPFAIVLDSAFFMMYHSAVIGSIYTNAIYQSEAYLIVLFVGGIILRTMFYLTHHFAVPALGHGILNAFVSLVTLGFVSIPLGYGLVILPLAPMVLINLPQTRRLVNGIRLRLW